MDAPAIRHPEPRAGEPPERRDGGALERDRTYRAEALRWLPDVTRFALALTRDEAEADDLVQETFLQAYESWHTYQPGPEGGTSCRAWLFTICRRKHLRYRMREARHDSTDDAGLEALASVALHVAARAGGYDDLFTRFDLSDAIAQAIGELAAPFRDAVVLVDLEDQSYEDAAAALGIPIGTVRSRLFRARRLLQEALVAHARDAGLIPRSAPAAGIPTPDRASDQEAR